MPIWQESDPVHLTNAAYGDIAGILVWSPATNPSVDMLRRPPLESVVTKPRAATAANMTPGWILGEAQQGGRGRGAPGRGFGSQPSPGGRQAPYRGGATGGCPTKKEV